MAKDAAYGTKGRISNSGLASRRLKNSLSSGNNGTNIESGKDTVAKGERLAPPFVSSAQNIVYFYPATAPSATRQREPLTSPFSLKRVFENSNMSIQDMVTEV